jgi:hypothetical protein
MSFGFSDYRVPSAMHVSNLPDDANNRSGPAADRGNAAIETDIAR